MVGACGSDAILGLRVGNSSNSGSYLPLLYTHGITLTEVGSQVSLKCSDVITKLKEIVNGRPIASLMTAMDNFLYGIREPFIFTLVALWSLAFLICANTMLYRLDVLHIRSHLIRAKASHHIDVKALLTKGRKMLSLYKDVDYFDEDPIGYIDYWPPTYAIGDGHATILRDGQWTS
ncbi:hypothetical protein BBBOND_0311190 [Babesia bigemina]|uniref:Uncharacterized protein n=1 Tax=Babesia bigemina TaxID=5866 RepID=A0A061D944_BABBI|nr:hypothetical protein BBBOND_0311190 [Babesia bigemina]CDR97216.1 hypothetical protein BBBOND_0311190 [Babesia bigemina]|eukprot:XP_012769402.1 hypothetical protein BBBOND_0311190 [Babesia bigemina]